MMGQRVGWWRWFICFNKGGKRGVKHAVMWVSVVNEMLLLPIIHRGCHGCLGALHPLMIPVCHRDV